MIKKIVFLILILSVVISASVTAGGIDSYVVLMQHNDDAGLTDSSSTARSVTLNGSMTRSATQSKFGGFSAFFDNTDDYMTMTANAVDDFGTADFTVDWWDYSATQSLQTAMGMEDSAWMVVWNSATEMYFYKDTVTQVNWTTTSRTNNTWYHMEFDRNGNNMYYFQNGVSQGTKTVTGWDIQCTNDFQVGRWSPWGTYSGYQDELRISKGIARHTSDFTPESTAYTQEAASKKLMLLGVG